jgi:ribosomal protein S27AE
LIKCFNCEWEGEEAQLVERPGNLIFYDYIVIDMGMPDVVRMNYLCPKCNVVLRTHRMSNGMIFDQ